MRNLIHKYSLRIPQRREVVAVWLVTVCLSASHVSIGGEAANSACQPTDSPQRIIASETLDVLSLNIAHGRGRSLNQMLVTRQRHRENLSDIAALLARTDAHVIALQEADAESLWSGGFDHVQFLVDATGYNCFIHGHHADTWLFTFGAALMSRTPISDADSHTFRPSWPTTMKGFVRGTVYWQNGGDAEPAQPVTIISVHLDFSRRKVREAQIAEMVEALSSVSTPVVILGDFNADWNADDSPVREVAGEFGLRPYTPTEGKLGTYGKAKRLDWILISKELQFVKYEVVPGLVSDHLALLAKIGWAGED